MRGVGPLAAPSSLLRALSWPSLAQLLRLPVSARPVFDFRDQQKAGTSMANSRYTLSINILP